MPWQHTAIPAKDPFRCKNFLGRYVITLRTPRLGGGDYSLSVTTGPCSQFGVFC